MNLDSLINSASPNKNLISFENFKKLCIIDQNTKVPPIIPSICISNSVVCTEGGLLVISGQKKAGKSNGIVNILATALIKEHDPNSTLTIRANYTEKKIIYIDTEQHKSTTKEFINKVVRIAKLPKQPDNLIMYNLTDLGDYRDKWEVIKEYVLSQDNIGLLVIDGVADIVKSVNDEEKAKEIVDYLLSKINNCSIVVTIHEGKDNNGATGHIGQIFEKKCTGTIAFFKDRKKGIHTMKCKLLRFSGDFDDIHFKWCDEKKGFRLLDENETNKLEQSNEEQKNRDLINLCNKIFAVTTEMNKDNLVESFKKYDTSLNLNSLPPSIKKSIDRKISKMIDVGILEILNNGNIKTKLK